MFYTTRGTPGGYSSLSEAVVGLVAHDALVVGTSGCLYVVHCIDKGSFIFFHA
jgi:hypothetical protein